MELAGHGDESHHLNDTMGSVTQQIFHKHKSYPLIELLMGPGLRKAYHTTLDVCTFMCLLNSNVGFKLGEHQSANLLLLAGVLWCMMNAGSAQVAQMMSALQSIPGSHSIIESAVVLDDGDSYVHGPVTDHPCIEQTTTLVLLQWASSKFLKSALGIAQRLQHDESQGIP